MKRLTVQQLGTDVQGVTLKGRKDVQPEPLHFRVTLPFGDVDIARCDDGSYWVHLHVNRPEGSMVDPHLDEMGTIADARLDCHGQHASDTRDMAEPLRSPGLYHLAVRRAPAKGDA